MGLTAFTIISAVMAVVNVALIFPVARRRRHGWLAFCFMIGFAAAVNVLYTASILLPDAMSRQ